MPIAAMGRATGAVDIDNQRLGGGIPDNPVDGFLPTVVLDNDFGDIEAGHMIRDIVLCHRIENPDADNDQQNNREEAPKRQAPLQTAPDFVIFAIGRHVQSPDENRYDR